MSRAVLLNNQKAAAAAHSLISSDSCHERVTASGEDQRGHDSACGLFSAWQRLARGCTATSKGSQYSILLMVDGYGHILEMSYCPQSPKTV